MLFLFIETVATIIPVVTIIAALALFGWWVAQDLLSLDYKRRLSGFVGGYLIPFWLFLNAVTADLAHLTLATHTVAYFIAVLVLVLITLNFKTSHSATVVLASIYSNTLYFSLPIIALVLDSSAMKHALAIIMINTLVVLSCYEILKAREEAQRLQLTTVRRILLKSLSNPIVACIVLGLILNVVLGKTVVIFGSIKEIITMPVLCFAVICLGVSIQMIPQQRRVIPWFAVLNKLFIFPLLVFCCTFYVFDLANDIVQVSVIF